MSRIGNAIIIVPKDVTVTQEADAAVVRGPKGELRYAVPQGLGIVVNEKGLEISCRKNDKTLGAIHGYFRAELANAITGVSKGWTRTLELSGVGYRAAVNGTNLMLTVGFSHPVTIVPEAGITFAVNEGKIVVSGIDKQRVGQTAATIREVKKPEPYKGKGIKYENEYIRKKAGKAKAVGGAPGAAK
jgi:large subunit ribosomal protein L6